jgi:hypothetical protein
MGLLYTGYLRIFRRNNYFLLYLISSLFEAGYINFMPNITLLLVQGLTPKRNKLQRNPRVKNRVKFEKAKKRRKGAVREVKFNCYYMSPVVGVSVCT